MQALKAEFEKSGGEFREWKLSELFESSNGDFDIQKKHINNKGDLVITAGLTNNGILGRSDVEAAIFPKKTITIDMFGAAFYRDFQYKMVTHARVFSLKPKFEITDRQGIFLSATLIFLRNKFEYGNMCSWAKIQTERISLPTTSEGTLAFDYMEAYIRELEEERVRELAAYLKVSGLEDYTLTAEEEVAIERFRAGEVETKEVKIGELFEKLDLRFKKKKFVKDQDISKVQTKEFDLPLVNAKFGDNGVMYYGRSCDFESAEMTIDIINDGAISTGTVYPQPQRTGVLYNAYLVKLKNKQANTKLLMYLARCLEKSIKLKFGYENKAGWAKVEKENISLPVTSSGEIDYTFMELYISGMQKMAIRNVVLWKDKVMGATQACVGASASAVPFPA